MMKFIAKAVAIVLTVACVCSCSGRQVSSECKAISEPDGKAIAKTSLQKFLAKLSSDGTPLTDGGKSIESSRFKSVSGDDLIYQGMPDMEPGSGNIYEFEVKGTDNAKFSVEVFDDCHTEPRWEIL